MAKRRVMVGRYALYWMAMVCGASMAHVVPDGWGALLNINMLWRLADITGLFAAFVVIDLALCRYRRGRQSREIYDDLCDGRSGADHTAGSS